MSIKDKLAIVAELKEFLWKRKLWWMIPLFIILVLFGLFIIFAQQSAVAPFIYVLF